MDAHRDRFIPRVVRRIKDVIRGSRSGGRAPLVPRFATAALEFEMLEPRVVKNPDRMFVGTGVKLGPNSELKATTTFPGSWLRHPDGSHVRQEFTPVIRIGDRVTATSSLQVVAFDEIVIEDDVMFAANVFVSDGMHGVSTGETAYKYQGISNIAPIHIGRGSWLGQNVVVLPGVTIGELAVIGANSVVTRDVPPQSIAVGAPARVVKRWDVTSQAWVTVGKDA